MSERQRKAPQPFSAEALVKTLFWLCIIAIVYACYTNILPYVAFVKLRVGNNFLANLPFVGWFFNIFSVSTIIGIVFWAILQIMQLLPISLKADRKLIRVMIREAENHPQLRGNREDSGALVGLKKVWNELPLKSIKWARRCAYVAYTIDFIACIHAFPPVNGGLDRFFYVISTRQFDKINLGNVISLIITVYLVEALVIIALQLQEFIYYHKLSRSEV
ncbi:hypothetical protein [Anabaena sp. CCY 9402-a]|uniref:hypothetical protein n=1 Tax=Anabaena sp. CCY 9402-a TaxID=3103867 RepID=UPI0039C6EC75